MGELGVTTETDLLQDADKRASEVLAENKDKLVRLADALFKKGTIIGKDLKKLL